ncbi:MAG: PilZ domain-containing protein [Candidatus Omnitrophica bacterium]|nr:PilZ domain-containing protein [Candidatus Omnitrophota bacterium]
MEERRAYRRFSVGNKSQYHSGGGIVLSRFGQVVNLSLGGMEHMQAERLCPGQKITASMHLQGVGPVVLHGTVVWNRESARKKGRYESGIRWTESNPTSQARLAAYLAKQQSGGPDVPAFTTTASGPPVVWWRAIMLGFLVFAILAAVDIFWLKKGNIYGERQTLDTVFRSAFRLTDQTLHRTYHKLFPAANESGTR